MLSLFAFGYTEPQCLRRVHCDMNTCQLETENFHVTDSHSTFRARRHQMWETSSFSLAKPYSRRGRIQRNLHVLSSIHSQAEPASRYRNGGRRWPPTLAITRDMDMAHSNSHVRVTQSEDSHHRSQSHIDSCPRAFRHPSTCIS